MATSKEKDASAQVPPTLATGAETATGRALDEAERDDVPQGAERGSQVEIEGGDPEPDALEGAAPQGAQTEPARFTSNGSLPINMVPSPSGSVPVGAVATSVEDGRKRVEEAQKSHDQTYMRETRNQRLSEATVGRIGRAELQAIGHTRGYEMDINAGTRKTRNDFLKFQDEDDTLSVDEPGSTYEGRPMHSSASRSPAKKSPAKKSSVKKSSRKSSRKGR